MASLQKTIAHSGTYDQQDTVLVPHHIFERKRRERERVKRAASTIFAQAIEHDDGRTADIGLQSDPPTVTIEVR
jgi:hypothetical protein